ncbi:MAG: hypothetical protein P8X48_08700 [Acidiferrobacteraceae bacterium]|jgi:hypothetical protein
MKRILFVFLAISVLSACATQYSADQIGPYPPDSKKQMEAFLKDYTVGLRDYRAGGHMHSVLKPVLTKYGWLTCAKYDGRDDRGETVTGNFMFSFVNGQLNKEMTMADSNCYAAYKTGRLDFSYRL